MTRHTNAATEMQHRQIDKLFGSRPAAAPSEVQLWETKRNANCDIHGRRGSGGSVRSLNQPRRDSVANSGYSVGLKEYTILKPNSIGSTILQNNSTGHWKNSFKRDSTPATSASLHNLASDLRNSMARIESLDNPATDNRRSTRSVTPAPRSKAIRQESNNNSNSSFSNGIRRTSMPVLNQQR